MSKKDWLVGMAIGVILGFAFCVISIEVKPSILEYTFYLFSFLAIIEVLNGGEYSLIFISLSCSHFLVVSELIIWTVRKGLSIKKWIIIIPAYIFVNIIVGYLFLFLFSALFGGRVII